jgi:tetratricopeptide (TPR) repeat protein
VSRPLRTRAAGSVGALVVLTVLGCGEPGAAGAQELDAKDLENRADYAYFTEDAAALRNLIRESHSAFAKTAPDGAMHYALGFAYYRLGSVLARSDSSAAATAMSECVDALDEALEADEESAEAYEESAEAYALASACLGQLAALRTISAMVNGPKSAARMEKALKLAPRNPRVVLLDALGAYSKPKAFGGDKAAALVKLRRAAELFDQAAAVSASATPGWGHADAQAALGRSLLESGDTLGARNALERALILAPDFAAARRLLAQVGAAR